MPKGKQPLAEALRRQWRLLQAIPHAPVKRTTTELAQALADKGVAVTKRTVERDLVALGEVFPTLECDDRERPYGWHWARGASAVISPR